MGNGNIISFWDDCWCGNQLQRVGLFSFYLIALVSSIIVNDVLDIYKGSLS